MARPRNPLLDDASTEIGIDLSFFNARDRAYQGSVGDPLLPGKTLKPSRLEDSRATRLLFHTISFYSTQYYISRALYGVAGSSPLTGRDHFVWAHHLVVFVFQDVAMPDVSPGVTFERTMIRVTIPGSARTVSFQPASLGSGGRAGRCSAAFLVLIGRTARTGGDPEFESAPCAGESDENRPSC